MEENLYDQRNSDKLQFARRNPRSAVLQDSRRKVENEVLSGREDGL